MGNNVYVGIDLGTTNTLVSYIKKEKPMLIKFQGRNILPSVIFADPENGSITVGEDARDWGDMSPEYMVSSAKTYMGLDKKYVFKLKTGDTLEMSPTDIAAEILKAAKEKIVKKLKLEADDKIYAVITTPAAFSFPQNEETKKAAKMAGIEVLGIRPEPVAAAIASVKAIGCNSTTFVVDIGGGTYDTAFVTFDETDTPHLISSEGDRRLGGDDFDRVVYDYVLENVSEYIGRDLTSLDDSGMTAEEYYLLTGTVRKLSREAKEALSVEDEYRIVYKDLCVIEGLNNNEPISFSMKLKREKFNELCSGILKKIEERLDESIKDFESRGHSLSEVSHLVLVGGSCNIPCVVELIEKKVGITSVMGSDKTAAVAQGAAIIAGNWNTVGANIGGVLAQSMGVEVQGATLSKIIEKGSTYPCSAKKTYKTTYDNQTKVDIAIYAAAPYKEDIEDIQEHEYYGYIVLDNIEKAPAGERQIEVEFSFDHSQQLTVTATDLSSGNCKSLIVNKEAYSGSRRSGKPVAIDLLIDVSGSMRGQPLVDAQNACRRMIKDIVDLKVHVVGITAFSNGAVNICSVTHHGEKLLKSIDQMIAWGGTNIYSGIAASCDKLKKVDLEEKIIFLMTDGAPNGGDRSEQLAEEIRKKYGVKIAVIYIGKTETQKEKRGFSFAQKVAENNVLEDSEKPLFYTSTDMSDLGNIFKKVYADITVA